MERAKSFDAKVIEVTAGNLRNNHIYLRTAVGLFPHDCIGGSNETRLGKPIRVSFVPGLPVETDIPEDKLIFRRRAEVGDFFQKSGIAAGEFVIVTRVSERDFEVRRLR